jgi:hypothetical protein
LFLLHTFLFCVEYFRYPQVYSGGRSPKLTEAKFNVFLIRIVGGESKLGPLGTSATSGLLYLPRAIVKVVNLVESSLAGEIEVLGENLPAVPLCPPQIPLDQTWARTRAAVVGSQQLTA